MNRLMLLIALSLFMVVGCTKEASVESDKTLVPSTPSASHEVNEINHYEVAKSMLEENRSKKVIDAYMIDHIDVMDIKDIDDIVLGLLERMQIYDEETSRSYFMPAIQTQLLERYDATTGNFDMENLGPELDFLKTSMDYGLVIHQSNNFITTDVKQESFKLYEDYISAELQLYFEITCSVINYDSNSGSDKERSERYLEFADTASKIEQLLIGDKEYRFNRDRLMSNMGVANINLAYFIPNSIKKLDNAYTSKEKLDSEIISLYEALLDKYSNVLGLEDTVNYIKRLKSNDYIIDDESNAYLEDILSFAYDRQFTESYASKLKSEFGIYNNKSEETYELLSQMVNAYDAMDEVFEKIMASRDQLTPEMLDRIILEYVTVVIIEAKYYNTLLHEEPIYEEVLKELRENGVDKRDKLEDKTVEFIEVVEAKGSKIVQSDDAVYCVPNPKYFSKLESLASDNINAYIEILSEYSNYKLLRGSLEDKIAYQYQLMNQAEEALLSYEFDEDIADVLCGIVYVGLKDILYESLLSDETYQDFLSGEGKIPMPLYNIYNSENEKFSNKFFASMVVGYIGELDSNNYNHTENTMEILNYFSEASNFQMFSGLYLDNIQKNKYMQ